MKTKTCFILYYTKSNKYSFNALLGALESDNSFAELEVFLYATPQDVLENLSLYTSAYDHVLVGVSFFTTQLWETLDLVKEIKEKKQTSNLTLIAGGPHPTGDPIGTLEMGFDVVVRGEGEETIKDLIKKVDEGDDYRCIKGIGYLDLQGRYVYTGRRRWIDLNEYPPFSDKYGKYGHIEITRGCPYACFYCQTPQLAGGIPRHRSIERVCKYVQILQARNLKDIRFISPNALSYGSIDGKIIDLEKVESLLFSVRGIVGKSGKIFFGSFPSEVRPEHVSYESVKLIKKYANNNNLIIGAQSGSRRILELCHRGHSLEDVYRAVDIIVNAGLKANVDFIFGLPGEEEQDVYDSIRVMKDLVDFGARIHAHTFMPLPQTRFAGSPAGRITEKVSKAISGLVSDGLIYGDWVEQEKEAQRIADYLKFRKLDTQNP